jgi:hypothetical protein
MASAEGASAGRRRPAAHSAASEARRRGRPAIEPLAFRDQAVDSFTAASPAGVHEADAVYSACRITSTTRMTWP